MNALHRLAFRIRAMRIDLLRASLARRERAIRQFEEKQQAALGKLAIQGKRFAEHSSMATRTRPPVPEFLRRGRA